MSELTRRGFLQGVSSVAAVAAVGAAKWVSPDVAWAAEQGGEGARGAVETLTGGWEYVRFALNAPWQVWSDQPLAPWQKVSLPHCVNAYDGCDPDVPCYRGKAWYRRRLVVANPHEGGRTLLHFEGAGQTSEVWIGETLAGRHVGGYDEFVWDITELVAAEVAAGRAKDGVALSVLCGNSPDLQRMPSDLSDFTLYGGLYRPVHLVYVPAVSVERVLVNVLAKDASAAQVRVRARMYAAAGAKTDGEVKVAIVVREPGGKAVFSTSETLPAWEGEKDVASFAMKMPHLWSPKNPHLYSCTVTLTTKAGVSAATERFGVRWFEFVEKGPFKLNGERLLIQGTHRHEDHAGVAAATPADVIRREMQQIKDMGANFIRLGHYQQQRLVLELCDELGIMVWEELTWCRAGVGDERWKNEGREKLTRMIDQHHNHPSVILWGLGNEDDWPGEYPELNREAIRGYMTELRDLAHKLDPSRLTSFRRCDFAKDIPDVYSPSIWAGWYGGRYVEYEASLTKGRDAVKHMLHVEYGADSHAGRYAEDPYKGLVKVKEGETAETGLAYKLEGGTPRVSRDGDWSETYACDLFDWHLKTQMALPWLTGALQWIFKDFTTPLRPENPVPRINQKGLTERDGTPKEAYFVFQSYWATKPMVRIHGHRWPVRWGKEGQTRTVRVYSNCASAELFVNGKSAGVKRRDANDFPCAGLRWEVPFAVGANALKVVATAADGAKVSDEVGFRYETELWGAPDGLKLKVVERKGDVCTVEAVLVDAKMVECLDARIVVRWSVAGEAVMVDNLGTVTGSRQVELANGRSQITITGIGRSAAVAVKALGAEHVKAGVLEL